MSELKIKRRLVALHGRWLALLALPFAAWLAFTDIWLPPKTSTISLWYAADTFDQCSRASPSAGKTFWIPTRGQIQEVEAALPLMLADRKRKGLKMPHESLPQQPFSYFHQYIGFVQNHQRMIYLNAYVFYDDATLNDEQFSLLEKPYRMCDGGGSYWGAVYHPDAKAFDSIEFNGQ